MAFPSVKATGAKPGDRVKCVDPGFDEIGIARFRKDQVYTVVDYCGTPSVHGHTDRRATKEDPLAWNIPWRGYGAKWELVS